MQRPLTGAWVSSCLCADFRAFRFTRRCLGGYPGGFASWAAPAWAVIGARDLRRSGRHAGEAAQVARAAEGNENTKSASAGISAETVPRPRAARMLQAFRMTVPVKNRGFLGGEILRTVRRPKTPGAPAGAQRSGSGGERRRSGTSEFCRLRRNERCVTCVDEVAPSEAEGAGPNGRDLSSYSESS